jgi:hypothetical protein
MPFQEMAEIYPYVCHFFGESSVLLSANFLENPISQEKN